MGLTIIEQSIKANSCAEWLQVCDAECCKLFILTLPKKPTFGLELNHIHVKKNLTKDQALYYQLHQCHYIHGELIVPLYDFEWREKEKELYIFNRCLGLTNDNKCKYHGTKGQPKICQYPNINDKGGEYVVMTPRCLYQYK